MPESGNPSVSVVDTQVPMHYPGPDQSWERKPPEDDGFVKRVLGALKSSKAC